MGHGEPRSLKICDYEISLIDFLDSDEIGSVSPLACTQREAQAELGGRSERRRKVEEWQQVL